jgi:hypothetical protein
MLDHATPILLGLQLPDEGELRRVILTGPRCGPAIGALWQQDSRGAGGRRGAASTVPGTLRHPGAERRRSVTADALPGVPLQLLSISRTATWNSTAGVRQEVVLVGVVQVCLLGQNDEVGRPPTWCLGTMWSHHEQWLGNSAGL